jgi:hypothetical protein
MNLKYINDFRNTFMEVLLYDGMKKPGLLARIAEGHVILAEPQVLKKSWIKTGMPDIASLLVGHFETLKKSVKKTPEPRL